MKLVHGSSAKAESLVGLGKLIAKPLITQIMPQAENSAWYPDSFFGESLNQPHLDDALCFLQPICEVCVQKGFKENQISLVGFSQGARLCLALAARIGWL